MNSKQRKKDAKYKKRLVAYLVSSVENLLDELESGKTSIKRERENIEDFKKTLKDVK